jgi:hypothetical protein
MGADEPVLPRGGARRPEDIVIDKTLIVRPTFPVFDVYLHNSAGSVCAAFSVLRKFP